MSLFPDTPNVTPVKSLAEVRRLGKRALLDLVGPAIGALERAIISGDKDDMISVKAACAVLDRTGFGAHSTITIDDKVDYTKMTPEELNARLEAAKRLLVPTPMLDENRSESGSERTSKVIEMPKSIH